MEDGYLRLSQSDSLDEEVLIRFANQHTQCFMSARILKHGYQLTPEHLKEVLQSKHVTYGIFENTLTTICLQANNGKPAQDILIAEGALGIPGQDGYFDYFIKPFSLIPDYNENESGKIDFHETHLFENVAINQSIGKLIPPVPGKEGRTVHNEKISVTKAKKCPVYAGTGISRDEASDIFTATMGGRVMLKFNKLMVTQELVIEKDVDFKTGHIDFIGFVQIRCDVLEGFNVQAKKGLQIAGNVSNSTISSEGDIILGGMSSREGEGIIRCGGDLKASYLSNVHIECEGCIQIAKEAVNCTLSCNGPLIVGGRIVGGSYIALGGIEAKQIGTEIGVKTTIICGDDFHFLNDINDLKRQIKEIQQKSLNAEEKHKQEFDNVKIETLPDDLKTRHETTIQFIKKLKQTLIKLQESLELIRQASADKSNPKINISEKLYPGTQFTLDCTQEEIKEEKSGPISISIDPKQMIHYSDMTPLIIPTQVPTSPPSSPMQTRH